jgi:hypothetical protein
MDEALSIKNTVNDEFALLNPAYVFDNTSIINSINFHLLTVSNAPNTVINHGRLIANCLLLTENYLPMRSKPRCGSLKE